MRNLFGPRIASMAPKLKAVSELGTVVENGNGCRAWLRLGRDLVVTGPTHYGRAARREAEADLAQARQASTRDEMQRRLRNLSGVSGSKATSLAEALPQPGQTHPCGGPHPLGETGHASCIAQPAESYGDTGVEQPAAGAKAVTQSVTVKASSSNARSACEQLPAKRARVAIEGSSSGVSQSAAAKQLPSLAGRVLNTESSADLKSEEKRKTLLLQLKRPHYNAIKDRRKLWEARPLFDGSGRQTIYDKLAVVGNAAVLQSGAGTNDRVRIAEVRRYIPQGLSYPLQDMVVELGAGLLPDAADTKARAQIYESLYGNRCFRGFVAMRIEWPNEAATVGCSGGASQSTDTGGASQSTVDSGGASQPTENSYVRHVLEDVRS
jgi:hypothetical protein